MHYILTAIAFLIIFSVLVLIHEFGHFIMAKRAGIKVEEFGFGLPPRLWGKKKGETIYSINWIPFGGFVKMLGEDATNKSALKNKRSFAGKPVSARIKVVVAGVIMNFFLAWLFLTVGFISGMQPLLMPEEILPAINDGVIQLRSGAMLEKVSTDSLAYKAGFRDGDVIYRINGVVADGTLVDNIKKNAQGTYNVYRGADQITLEIKETGIFGATFYDYGEFPRVQVHSIDPNSILYLSGLRQGDILLTIDDTQVFDIYQIDTLFRQSDYPSFTYYRNGQVASLYSVVKGEASFGTDSMNPFADKVIISRVYPKTPAAKAGLKDGDIIVSYGTGTVDGDVHDPAKFVAFTGKYYDKEIAYVIMRGKDILQFKITPENKKIGVLVSSLNSFKSPSQGVSFYNIDNLESAVNITEEKYPFYISAYKSFSEMWKISKVTATMFLGMIVDVFTTGRVPDSVSGPVGIAQMTSSIITEGLIVILRFMALLSLSLAVINILPLPALDGGRFLFLLFEVISGRRVNQKWEARIHAIGYVLIIFLILLITYSDILKIVKAW